MYVANRELRVSQKGSEKLLIIKAGEIVPDFENWDIHARRAALNNEYVSKVEGGAEVVSLTPAKPPSAKVSKVRKNPSPKPKNHGKNAAH